MKIRTEDGEDSEMKKGVWKSKVERISLRLPSVHGTNLLEFAQKRTKKLQSNLKKSEGKENARKVLCVLGIMMKIFVLNRVILVPKGLHTICLLIYLVHKTMANFNMS